MLLSDLYFIIFLCFLGCKTGEVCITDGYSLPARYVIHTVGPRYNIKYQTAAESALHYCYRCFITHTHICMHTQLPISSYTCTNTGIYTLSLENIGNKSIENGHEWLVKFWYVTSESWNVLVCLLMKLPNAHFIAISIIWFMNLLLHFKDWISKCEWNTFMQVF